MHLSAVHGSSYYSRSTNSVARVSFAPLYNALLPRNSATGDASKDWKPIWMGAIGILAAALLLFFLTWCWFKGRKAPKKQPKDHAQWYGH